MATNLAIDERLLEEALKVGKHKSKKDTVNEALKEYVMRRKRKNILSLFLTSYLQVAMSSLKSIRP